MSEPMSGMRDAVEAAARACDERANGRRAGNEFAQAYWRQMMEAALTAAHVPEMLEQIDRLKAHAADLERRIPLLKRYHRRALKAKDEHVRAMGARHDEMLAVVEAEVDQTQRAYIEINALREALAAVMRETGTSSLAHHIARAALANLPSENE